MLISDQPVVVAVAVSGCSVECLHLSCWETLYSVPLPCTSLGRFVPVPIVGPRETDVYSNYCNKEADNSECHTQGVPVS